MRPPAYKTWLAAACGLAVLFAVAAGCGGGGGGGNNQPPPPPTLVITTATMNDGVVGAAYSQTVAATGGTGGRTFSISAGSLPAGLAIAASTGVISGTPTGAASTANFTVQVVDSGTPQQTDTQALTIDINNPLIITTTTLPDAAIGSLYNGVPNGFQILATGGSGALSWTVSSGAVPAGLVPSADGRISGTPTAGATTQTFTVRVADGSSPQQVDTQQLTINILAATGRNDTIATATPLSNGTFAASISPSGDPNSSFAADVDVYQITANAGAIVTITVLGPGLNPSNHLDPVIEIVNAANVRFANNCRDPGDNSVAAPIIQDTTPAAFNDQCINDDISLAVTRDSMLEFQVPGAGVVTFFVRVLDFSGNARPDFVYQITISGAN